MSKRLEITLLFHKILAKFGWSKAEASQESFQLSRVKRNSCEETSDDFSNIPDLHNPPQGLPSTSQKPIFTVGSQLFSTACSDQSDSDEYEALLQKLNALLTETELVLKKFVSKNSKIKENSGTMEHEACESYGTFSNASCPNYMLTSADVRPLTLTRSTYSLDPQLLHKLLTNLIAMSYKIEQLIEM